MKRFLVRLVINAVALWLTTQVIGALSDPDAVRVEPFAPLGSGGDAESGTAEVLLTYLLVALIFGAVNGIIGNAIRIIAFPLYLLTLGLVALVVNGLLLLLVAWISAGLGFGLVVEGFWWGVLGALLLALFSWIINALLRPIVGRAR